MIGYLRGRVGFVGVDTMTIVCGGVGYDVGCPLGVLGSVNVGSEVELYMCTVFGKKEMRIDLYGFLNRDDRDLFKVLIGVSGVGAKVAMAMLNLYDAGVLKSYIAGKNVDMLCKVPGVGKRVAERLVLELSGKIDASNVVGGEDADLFEVLESLGYRHKDIVDIFPEIDGGLSLQDRVKQALRLLNK